MMEAVKITTVEYFGILTPLLLSLLALGVLVMDLSFFRKQPRATGIMTFFGLAAVFFVQWRLQIYWLNFQQTPSLCFGSQYYFDVYSIFFNYIFLIAAGATAASTWSHLENKEDHRGEYYVLLIIAAVGMCLMAGAHNLLILFIGLETMSIAVYVLAGMERGNLRSNEASIKYLLLGAFASAIFLYGAALVYGITGSLDYGGIAEGVQKTTSADQVRYLVLMAGVALILVGLFFKVAAVPFHMWTPDVYEGAPTPITGFMATGVKAAAFAGLVRLSLTAFTPLWGLATLYDIFYILAILTMTLGNLVAIAQRNLKRMLAYSSIAHAGYLLVGVTALVASGQFLFVVKDTNIAALNTFDRVYPSASSILFYLLAYTFMNLGAFGVMVALGREKDRAETLDDFSGLARRRPGLAAVMAICMLSLAGIPPLAGFMAKFYIFQYAIANRLYILAVIGVLNSVVSAYYYLRVPVVMYMDPEKSPFREAREGFSAVNVVNLLMAFAVVGLGLFPQMALTLVSAVFSPDMINLPSH